MVMGRSRRPQPARLADKLLAIRKRLDLSQGQMVRKLETEGLSIYPPHLSGFESGAREPSLLVILQYARVAGVAVEVLIDDKLELPKCLPVMRKRMVR